MVALSYASLAIIHGLFYPLYMIIVKLVSMEILKIIVWHVKLISLEFLIQMKIVASVVLDFMIMGKLKFSSNAITPGIIISTCYNKE